MRFYKASVACAIMSLLAAPFAAHAAPTVFFNAPVDGQTISGILRHSSACEVGGSSINRVRFYLDASALNTANNAPWQCNFDTTRFTNGAHVLRAVAYDSTGASTSTQIGVNIQNGTTSSTNTPPAVSILKPDGGASSSTQRAIRIKTAPLPVAASDIISRASADIAFANQSGYTAQVIGTYTSAPNIPESGINGTTLPNGETLRLGKVIDPNNSLRKALAFQVIGSDPTTSGGKRAELSVAPNIEMNKVYWIVFSAYVYDWGTLASTDNALLGTQMHAGDNSAGLSPSFGLYTSQYGRTFRVQARYSTSSDPTQSNSVSVRFTEYPIPFGQWADFVVKFKHNTSGSGILQVWMNGQQIANYQGNLGYNTGYKDYAKFGYYNWTASSMNGTARKVLLRSPMIVSDPTGQTYSLEQISALLGSMI